MKIIKKILPANHNLFLFGDAHIGSVLHHEDGFGQLVDAMLSPYGGLNSRANYGVDHSDGIEGITIDDMRFHPDNQPEDQKIPIPILEADEYIEKLKPIASKIITMLNGNHFIKLWRVLNVGQYICDRLNINYGTWTAKLIMKDRNGNLLYKSYHTHGRKAINSYADDIHRRKANMELILKRHLQDMAGDCVLMCKGHTHKLLVAEPTKRLYLTDDGGKVKQKYTKASHTAQWIHPDHRWYTNTGSFLKLFKEGVSGYAERAEYSPVELGYLVVRVRDREIQQIDKVVL